MKNYSKGFIILLSALTIAACSSQTSKSSNEKSEEPTASVIVETIDNSQYDEVVAEIKELFDSSDTGLITVNIENDVMDSDFPEPHNVIKILAIGDAKLALEELVEAEYSNTATGEQATALMLFRAMVSSVAKKLPDDTTTISFGYEINYNEYQLVALSSKDKDFIAVE